MDATRRIPAEVFPPGEFLRDELEARGWTQADLAVILNKPLPAVNEIITGKKAITPETARSLAEAFGVEAQFWLNLESAYRLSLAAPSDSNVGRRARLYSAAPVKELIKRNWIRASSSDAQELEKSLLAFYRATSLDDIQKHKFAARKSSPYSVAEPSEWAWYCRAFQMAESFRVRNYSESAVRTEGLTKLHRLTTSEEEVRKVPAVLSELGIRFVVVERLPKMRVDGVAFWLDEDEPVIAMTLRADRIDGFWFTLAHELAHILNRDQPYLDTNLVGKDRQPTDEKPETEKRADRFASDFLIPQREIDRFILRVRPLYSKVLINQFAGRIGVHPGIVVGQLQHRREIGWEHSREMLVKVRGKVISTAYVDGWGSEPDLE